MSTKEKRIKNDVVFFLMAMVEASMEKQESPDKLLGKVECFLNVYERYKKVIYPNARQEIDAFIKSLQDSGYGFAWE